MQISQKCVTFDEMASLELLAQQSVEAGDAVFDCSLVEKADSALLALILKWLEAAHNKQLEPKIINLPEGMWSLAKLYGVRSLIRPYCQKCEQAD